MVEKRYAIVRVDDKCPYIVEDFDSTKINNMFKCYDVCKKFKNGSCKTVCRYGDTKEQLIRKILQVMMRKYTISYLRTTRQDKINQKHFKSAIDYYLEIAKEIVEFLGVE